MTKKPESQSKPKPKPKPCKHQNLHFEAGGFHIVCTDCKHTWNSVGHCPLKLIVNPMARAEGLTELDKRKDPNQLFPTSPPNRP